jgi:hypothetical protein
VTSEQMAAIRKAAEQLNQATAISFRAYTLKRIMAETATDILKVLDESEKEVAK